jgi:hypothetical protein
METEQYVVELPVESLKKLGGKKFMECNENENTTY